MLPAAFYLAVHLQRGDYRTTQDPVEPLKRLVLRELMFKRVRSLHEAGEAAEAIRLATGLGHRTVRRWIRLKTLHWHA
jgi:hypothetical protein